MITVNEVHAFYDKYNENNRQLSQKTEELYRKELDMQSWMDLLRDRGSLARQIYLENQQSLETVIRPFVNNPEDLTPELVEAFLEEITPLVASDYPDFEITERMLDSIITYMEGHGYTKLQILQVKNSRELSRIVIKQPVRTVDSFPGLSEILSYIDENTGSESLIHVQNLILMLTVKRRVHTFIHSVIVSKLATIIARAMIVKKPGFFSNVGTDPADILGFINAAALLHDIGKTDIAHVINTEDRQLTKAELDIIRTHPDIGGDLLSNIPSLKQFADIARGHHIFHDGSSGYPEGFDISRCKYRNVIDLISICDSIDAGTDNLGRSYAESKTLTKLLEELENGKGTRYSAEIVDAILGDDVLIDQLQDAVTVGRENVCYDVYHQYNSEE